jgi:hypothetical protein
MQTRFASCLDPVNFIQNFPENSTSVSSRYPERSLFMLLKALRNFRFFVTGIAAVVTFGVTIIIGAVPSPAQVTFLSAQQQVGTLVDADQITFDSYGNVFYPDPGSGTISEIKTGSTTPVVVASGLNYPTGIAVDSSGNLYTCAYRLNEVIKIAPNGAQSVLFQNLNAPRAVAVDNTGDIFVSENGNVLKFTSAGVESVVNSTPGVVYSLATDPSGDLYEIPASFATTGSVTEYLTNGTTATVFTIQGVSGLTVDQAGNITEVSLSGTLAHHDASTGVDTYTQLFNFPFGVAVAPGGSFFVTEQTNNGGSAVILVQIGSLNLGNVNVCPAGQSSPAPCNNDAFTLYYSLNNTSLGSTQFLTSGASNLDFTASGDYCSGARGNVSCQTNVNFAPTAPGPRSGAVELTDPSGNVLNTVYVDGIGVGPAAAFNPGTQITVASGINQPTGVAVDGGGNMLIASGVTVGELSEVPAAGGPATTLYSYVFSGGVAVDGAGNRYITQGQNGVQELSASGQAIGNPLSGFQNADGVAVDSAGNLYVSDAGAGSVVKIASTGSRSTIAIGLKFPIGIAVDGAGDVFVAESGQGQVVEIPANGGPQVNIPVNGSSSSTTLYGVAMDAAGDLFVSDFATGLVSEIPAGGGPQFSIGTGFAAPTELGLDRYGNLFVPDLANNDVVEIIRSQVPGLSFAPTPVGRTSSNSPQSVQIQNIGNQPLTALPPGLSIGANFVQVAGNGTFTDCTSNFSVTAGALCNLSVSFEPTTIGSIQSAAVYTDNSLNASPSAMQSVALLGTGLAVAPTITFNGASYAYGQSFAAMATSNSAGAITYSLVSGPATVTTAGLVATTGAGTVVVQASEQASGNYTQGTQTAQFTINAASTATTLTGSMVPSPGNTAVLKASVAPPTTGSYPVGPTGTVTFFDGATALTTISLVSGSATYTTPALAGTQTFTATYNGDTNFKASAPSNSVQLNLAVAPTITFATAASYAYGQTFQATASTAGGDTGTFTYSLVSGPTTVTPAGSVTMTGEGPVTIQATEAASTGFLSGSKTASFTAVQAASTTTLIATAVKSGYGTAATLVASIAPQFGGTPTGTVSFYAGTTLLGKVAVTPGSPSAATFTTAALVGAQHSFTATYSGDPNFITSTSKAASLTIPTTSVTFRLLTTQLVYPEPPAFEINITPSGSKEPTGTVTIFDGSNQLSSYSLYAQTKGVLLGLVLPPLNVGNHMLQAVYSGDANYPPGQSAVIAVTVTPGPVKLSLSCASTKLQAGQTLSCSVNADDGPLPVTGTVNYTITGLTGGSLSLNTTGAASIIAKPIGNGTLTVTYAAQGNYQAAARASISYTVK